jgi:methyl-accepting chemotaxis protein
VEKPKKMLSNLKLKGKLFIAFLVPVSLALGFGGIVYSASEQLSETFQEVSRTEQVIISNYEITLRISLMGRQIRGYLLNNSEAALKDYENQKLLYKEAANIGKEKIKNPEQKERFNQMLNLTEQFDAKAREAIRLEKEGKHNEAVTNYLRDSEQIVAKLNALKQELLKNEQAILAGYTQSANNSIEFLVVASIITGAIIFIFSCIAGYFIWVTVANTVQKTVNTIATSSNEIAATVVQQELSATQQATSVNQTTTTMDELGVSAKQSAQKAELAANSAKQVSALAEQGSQAVEHTLEDMLELKNTVVEIAEKIVHLSSQTNQIGSIINLVSELANQTNMLALNAAVEAVRAGEHGKGFGVVATEIRKLADASKKSAEKINLLVNDIQNAINSTARVADEGKKRVDGSVNTAEEMSNTFTKVAEAINDVVANNMQISLNAKQQAIAIEQVVDAMNSLNQGAVQTASGITQTKVGTQRLNEAVLDLQAVV